MERKQRNKVVNTVCATEKTTNVERRQNGIGIRNRNANQSNPPRREAAIAEEEAQEKEPQGEQNPGEPL